MARWSSRSDVKTSVRPSAVVTFQKSSLKSPSLRRILNLCPQLVHLTVVPRPLTSASSNSYSVLQRSHLTSISSGRPLESRLTRGPRFGRMPCHRAPALAPPPRRGVHNRRELACTPGGPLPPG